MSGPTRRTGKETCSRQSAAQPPATQLADALHKHVKSSVLQKKQCASELRNVCEHVFVASRLAQERGVLTSSVVDDLNSYNSACEERKAGDNCSACLDGASSTCAKMSGGSMKVKDTSMLGHFQCRRTDGRNATNASRVNSRTVEPFVLHNLARNCLSKKSKFLQKCAWRAGLRMTGSRKIKRYRNVCVQGY